MTNKTTYDLLSTYDLPYIDKLIEQGQPQFGVFSKVNQINYLDYYSHLISQKPIAQWRKQLKANQFAFIQIVHGPYRICMAVATIKLATTAFAYIYHEETQQFEIVEALLPLTINAQFSGDHKNGEMIFEHNKLALKMTFSPELVSVRLNSKVFAVNADLQRAQQPLAVCSPSGRRGWTFTQKEPFDVASGELILHSLSKHYFKTKTNDSEADTHTNIYTNTHTISRLEFDASTRANLDWTLGFMRHETNWFWSCINTQLEDGRQFMLNLSMGVNETGISENACWLDGKIHYLPPVMFRRGSLDGNKSTTWSISHQNLGWSKIDIELIFTPIKVYKKTDNYALVASIFEQWIGYYSGHIRLANDEVIVLDQVMGLAEDHFAKW